MAIENQNSEIQKVVLSSQTKENTNTTYLYFIVIKKHTSQVP